MLAAVNFFNGSLNSVGNHNFMYYRRGFINCAENVAALNLIACAGSCLKVPELFAAERRNINTSLKVGSAEPHNLLKRSLNTVVNRTYKAGAQLYRKRHSRCCYALAGAEACGFLIYLNGSPVLVHFNNLADKVFIADAYNVVHISVAHTLGNNERSRNLCYGALFH